MHQGQHLVAAGQDRGRVGPGVQPLGGTDLAGQGGGLGGGELLRLHAEEGAGRGRDAVGTLPEVHLVEVALEELVLGVVALELGRVQHLPQLAEEGVPRACVVELGQLLGNRAPALHTVALDVTDDGPDQGGGVDGAVAVEVGVLGGEDGVRDVRRQLP